MRRSARMAAVAGCALVAVVSCSSSPPVTFTAQTTTLDDGAFTITTARAQATVITQSAAEFDLAHSDLGAPVGRSSRSSSATSQ